MKYVTSIFSAAVLACSIGGWTTPHANASVIEDLAGQCALDPTKLSGACTETACAQVLASTGLAEADQAELGRSIAQLVQDRSALDPEGADALQACVTGSPATVLVAAFQGKLDTVADIGEPVAASAR